MSIFDYFLRREKQNSAAVAKERLQIIVAHERNKRQQPDYLVKMQEEILSVIKKYVDIDLDDIQVNLDNNDDCSVLELNITLPEQ